MPSDAIGAQTAHLVISSDPLAVRQGLQSLCSAPPLSQLSTDDRGMAELLLAEVLNNVVEHAYAGVPGEIEVTLARQSAGVLYQITDSGSGMPDGCLPDGISPLDTLGPAEPVPEGGFGWHLIRALSVNLRYERKGGQNRLSFLLPDQPPDPS